MSVQLAIVGNGYERDRLRALADELGVSDAVTWVGAPDRAEMPAIYRDADAFVLASRHESFGVVVIEALASGLPVVATRCGGPEEIVTDACGLLVPPDDPASLAQAMTAVVRGQFERDAIRRYFAETYSSAAIVPRLAELYQAVLDERGAPPA